MEVTVVGSCNVDLISYVSRLPKPGETIQGKKFSMGLGGKGANQCVMSTKLGAKTAMVAKVGVDTFGDNFVKAFKDLGVCTDYLSRTDAATTGTAPISVDDSVRSILNPAPAVKLEKAFFENTDIFCPNETETEILTGINVSSVEDAKEAVKHLRELGCKDVIITLGEMGCVVAESGTDLMVPVTAPKVEVKDTTGAGDSFIGALAFYLSTMPGLGLVESVKRAVQIASVSVQRMGTQTSMPVRSELPENLFS